VLDATGDGVGDVFTNSEFGAAELDVLVTGAAGAREIDWSGLTLATAGLAASAVAWSTVTVAENALPSVKYLTLVGAGPDSCFSTADSSAWASARRADRCEASGGVLANWFASTTTTASGVLSGAAGALLDGAADADGLGV
jgi:hypothetical protein